MTMDEIRRQQLAGKKGAPPSGPDETPPDIDHDEEAARDAAASMDPANIEAEQHRHEAALDAAREDAEPEKVATLLPEGFTPPKAPGPCTACGNDLIIIPVNSRVRAYACNNHGCRLYRQHASTFSLPVPGKKKNKRRRSNAKNNSSGRKN